MARYSDFVKRWAARRSRGEAPDTSRKIFNRRTPQDVTSPRAKSQRKGKVTAEHWNQ